jgi:hypothetical protein
VSIPKLSARIRVEEEGLLARDAARLALLTESAGADAFFVNGRRAPGEANDPFVVLGAAAESTSRIMLGCVATPVDERLPSILAKTLAALDVCSGGRAMACLALGGVHDSGTLDELLEAIAVVRAMLEVEAPTFSGEHFSIKRAWNEPRAQRARPMPIGVELCSPPLTDTAGTLEVAGLSVALADVVDFLVSDARPASALPPSFSTPQICVVESGPGLDGRVRAAFVAGYAGVTVDFAAPPNPDELVRALGVARSALERHTGAPT